MSELEQITQKLDNLERMFVLASKEVLNTSECALWLGLSESRIRQMATVDRVLPHYKFNGRLFFKKSEVDAELMKERIASQAEIEAEAATYIVKKRK